MSKERTMLVKVTLDSTYALAGSATTRAFEVPDDCRTVHVHVRGDAPDGRKSELRVLGVVGGGKDSRMVEAVRVPSEDIFMLS
jgi:hypothetical protein